MPYSSLAGSTHFLAQTGSRLGPDTLNVIVAPSPCAAQKVAAEVLGQDAKYTHLDRENSNTLFWVGQGRIGACYVHQADGTIEAIKGVPADPKKIKHVQQLLASLNKQ